MASYTFPKCSSDLSAKYQNKGRLSQEQAGNAPHTGNHAPAPVNWGNQDDTLSRQGVTPGSRRGHGICKGLASAWVISFISDVREVTDPKKFEDYFTNVLRFQATYIKDYGSHIDSHLNQIARIGQPLMLRSYYEGKEFERATFDGQHFRDGHLHAKWGAYLSVWGHDIAIGSSHGSTGPFYILEPNTGLMGYNTAKSFGEDLNGYLDHRRTRKGLPLTTKFKSWCYI